MMAIAGERINTLTGQAKTNKNNVYKKQTNKEKTVVLPLIHNVSHRMKNIAEKHEEWPKRPNIVEGEIQMQVR